MGGQLLLSASSLELTLNKSDALKPFEMYDMRPVLRHVHQKFINFVMLRVQATHILDRRIDFE